MTIESQYGILNYTGDGSTTAFAVTWPFASQAELTVALQYVEDDSDYSPAPVLNGDDDYDYTVTGTEQSDLGATTGIYTSGTITFNTAPPATLKVVISRTTTITQTRELQPSGRLSAKTLEAMADRLTMIAQELEAAAGSTASADSSAATSANDAADSADDAAASATAAASSATAAASSASSAASSTSESVTAAAASATEAAASATAAAASETNAAASETAAAASASSAQTTAQELVNNSLYDLYFESMALTAPPDDPTDGDMYLVASGATGDWAGEDGKIAYSYDDVWSFLSPKKGQTAYNAGDATQYLYTGSDWISWATLISLVGSVLATGKILVGDSSNQAAAWAPASGRLGITSVSERMTALDCLLDCKLISMTLTTPPDSPEEGDAYLVADDATGDWVDSVGKIAYYTNSAWVYYTPFAGLTVYNAGDDETYRYSGSKWAVVDSRKIDSGSLLANLTDASAHPDGAALSAVLDYVLGSTQGAIIYRGASGWAVLAPGTSGQFLSSSGADANPAWADGTSLSAIADQTLLANISGANSTPAANTLSAIIDACLGSTQGNLLYRGASGWAVLAPGTSGQVLTSSGSEANPAWADSTGACVDLYDPPSADDFSTLLNEGAGDVAPSVTDVDGLGMVFSSGSVTSSSYLRAALKSVSENNDNFQVSARIKVSMQQLNYRAGGICVFDGTVCAAIFLIYASGPRMSFAYWSDQTGERTVNVTEISSRQYEYVRLSLSSGTLSAYISEDGRNWVLLGTLSNVLSSVSYAGPCALPWNYASGVSEVYVAIPYWSESST